MNTLTAPVSAAVETHRPLNATDRCDRCGAQAYLSLVMPGTMLTTGPATLMFCLHHANKHADSALIQGFVIAVDERHKLLSTNPQDSPS